MAWPLSLAVLKPPKEISLFVKPNWVTDGSYVLPAPCPFEYVYKAMPGSRQARLPSTVMVGNSFSDAFARSGYMIYFKDLSRVRTHPNMWSEIVGNIPPGCRYLVLQMIEVEIPWLLSDLPPLP